MSMEKVIEKYNDAYHALEAKSFEAKCSIIETENKKKEETFYEIELTGFDGYQFPHDLSNKLSSFVTHSTKSSNKLSDNKTTHILGLDCDGILLFEKDGRKYMLICELKSKPDDKQDILKARKQIVGSYIKMNALMGTLSGVKTSEYIPIGLIVSFLPMSSTINALSKAKDEESSFLTLLFKKNKVDFNKLVLNSIFKPFETTDISIYFCGVPNRQRTYSIDINTIIP